MLLAVLTPLLLAVAHLGPAGGQFLAADLRLRCGPGSGRHRRRPRHAAPKNWGARR
ncbi:hypothetical protein ABIA33_005623 [Streptacidiphilus sp. MAP12-16]